MYICIVNKSKKSKNVMTQKVKLEREGVCRNKITLKMMS